MSLRSPPQMFEEEKMIARGTWPLLSKKGTRAVARYLPAMLAAALGIVLSILAGIHLREREHDRLAVDLAAAGASHAQAIQEALDQRTQELESLDAFFASSQIVDPSEFRTFLRPVFQRHPSVCAAVWAPLVSNASLPALEMTARQLGDDDFRVRTWEPQGTHKSALPADEHAPALYVEPSPNDNILVGLDVSTWPPLSEALLRARVGGAETVAGLLALRGVSYLSHIRPIAGNPESRMLPGVDPGIAGFIITLEDITGTLNHALRRLNARPIDLHIFDTQSRRGTELVACRFSETHQTAVQPATEASQLATDLHYAKTLRPGDREWLLMCTPAPGFAQTRMTHSPWIVVAIGLAFTCLLTAYFTVLLTARHRADRATRAQASLAFELERALLAREAAEANREKLLRAMEQRVKELRCLYGVAETVRKDARLEWIFKTVVDQLPAGFQYPETTRARIRINADSYTTEPFSEGHWTLTSQIHAGGRPCGTIEVHSLADSPQGTAGPFLEQERDLIEAVAHTLSEVIEKDQAQRQLVQAQKLESIGQLAAGIAHEINTPTQFVGDNARFLKDSFDDLCRLFAEYKRLHQASRKGAVPEELLGEIARLEKQVDIDYLTEEIPVAIEQTLEGVERVSKIVHAMREFSHPSPREVTSLDVNHAIETTVTVARNEWKYVADLETDLQPDLPLIMGLPDEFNQVILNLLVNAAQALGEMAGDGPKEKGKIRIRTRGTNDHIEVSISDTGPGIPEKIQQRIFDPFFTTKPVGQGTGQGLAIALSVVKDKHGGTLACDSKIGQGTTFKIELPVERAA
jgi:signal transduction histidine kinase